jgi:DNA-binding transcriptional regulator GbsR (MarR family)
MQHTVTIKQEIRNTQSSVDSLTAEINREIDSCTSDLDLIKKQQKLKPQYDLRSRFENKLDALKLQLAHANNVYNIAKAKLDLIYKHSITNSGKEAVMTNASTAGS